LAARKKTANDFTAKAEQSSAARTARKAAKAEQTARAAEVTKAANATKLAKLAKAAAGAPTATATKAVAGAETYLINVGLFADPNNARNAYTRLMDAGLPAVSQPLTTAKGERTRVRVGPFESFAEADAAAEKIRLLKLEAAVFKP
jgi:cell division septation protein DedD